jgi:hypothetical protein
VLGSLEGGARADERLLVTLVLGGVQCEQLIEEGIDSFPVLNQLQHQLILWQRDEGVCNVAHPEHGGLPSCVRGKLVEVDVDVKGDEADLCVLCIGDIVQGHLDRLHNLLEVAKGLRELAHVDHKDEGRLNWWPRRIGRRRFKLVGAKLKLWSLQAVTPLSKFIQGGLIVNGNLIHKVAKITLGVESAILEYEVRVDIGLAAVAPERSLLSIVNEG